MSADPEVRPHRRPFHDREARGVYQDADRVGHVVLRDNQFLAFNRLHRPLGRFGTAVEATAAVLHNAEGKA
jgi:hypothetical protein